MNAEQILAELEVVYANCTTYRDKGHVTCRWLQFEGGIYETVRPFETAFIRPDRFRFEYHDRSFDDTLWRRYIISADRGCVRSWWDITPGIEQQESLSLALAGATGVSGGSAHNAPRLLLPEQITGRRLTDLDQVTSLSDAPLGNVTCYRIQGRVPYRPPESEEFERLREEVFRTAGQRLPRPQPTDDVITLWIDRGSFLVRRIEDLSQFKTGEPTGLRTHAVEQITEYEPEIGVVISEHELRFDPPS